MSEYGPKYLCNTHNPFKYLPNQMLSDSLVNVAPFSAHSTIIFTVDNDTVIVGGRASPVLVNIKNQEDQKTILIKRKKNWKAPNYLSDINFNYYEKI